MKHYLAVSLIWMVCGLLWGQSWVGPGRGTEGLSLEITGGIGGVEDVKGTVNERISGGGFTGGLNLDLGALGIDEDASSQFFGVKLMNAWVTFFANVYQGSVAGAGTTDEDVRLSVDGVSFAGQTLEFLLIPQGGEYDLELDTTWIGVGGRLTPLTLNPEGRVRVTPWLHLGVQYVELSYDVNAGATTTIQVDAATQRTFAVRGRARNTEEALLPEYGFGGEIRVDLWEQAGRPVQVVGDATFKKLDLQDGLGSLGFDDDAFDGLDFNYESLEMNVYVLFPLTEGLDLLGGVYVEQVEMAYTLMGDRGVAGLDREISLEYMLYGVKAGLKF